MPSVFFVVVESLSDFKFSDVSHPQMSHQPVMFQRRLMSQLHNSSYPPPGILLSRAFFFLLYMTLQHFVWKQRPLHRRGGRSTDVGSGASAHPSRGFSLLGEPSKCNLSPPPLPSLKALRLIFWCALNQEGHFSAGSGRAGGATDGLSGMFYDRHHCCDSKEMSWVILLWMTL